MYSIFASRTHLIQRWIGRFKNTGILILEARKSRTWVS